MISLSETVSMECPGEEWSPEKKQSVANLARTFSVKVRYNYCAGRKTRIVLTGRGIDIGRFLETERRLKGEDEDENRE